MPCRKEKGKPPNPTDELGWRSWVSYKLGQHTAYFKILIPLIVVILGLILGLYFKP